MAFTPEQQKLFSTKYAPKWNAGLQQTASILRNYATVLTGLKGEKVRLKKIGLREMNQYTDGRENTYAKDSETETRLLTYKKFRDGETIDPDMELNIEDNDGYVTAVMDGMKAGAERCLDKQIIDAAMGSTLVSGADGSTSALALPDSQIIQAKFVWKNPDAAANLPLTFDKLRRAKTILTASHAYKKGEVLVAAMSEEDMMDLLGDEKATSSDYQNVKSLIDGEIDKFLGFKILRTEQLRQTGEDTHGVLCYVKSSVQIGIWRDATFELFNRTDKSNAPHIQAKMACGGGRLHDEGIVKILCA